MDLDRSALGLALRPAHVARLQRAVEEGRETGIGFLELLSENYLRPDALPRLRIEGLCRALPVVLHGVSLDLLGPTRLDPLHLASLRTLAESLDAHFVTDHLAWCASARGPPTTTCCRCRARRTWCTTRSSGSAR